MASNVEFSVGSKLLRRVAIVAFLGAIGGAAVSSCADSDTVTTGGSNTSSSSSGKGGEGNAGGSGGASSSSSASSTSGNSSSSGTGGSGGMMCVPETEVCDGKDNDCNDKIDDTVDGCDCVTGQTQNCYSGPVETLDKGICKGGTQTCDANGKWGVCEGEILPAMAETCEGTDETCDGNVDEGCACTAGQTQSCYTGPMGTSNTGVCKPGSQLCDVTGAWGACTGSITPSPEVCNGLDDDCNGSIDNDNPGGGDACVAPGLGECKKGTLNCVNGAVKCTPAPVQPEVCDGLDNNCDGNTDEGNPGGGMQCMTGFMGLCATGLTKCDGMNGVICQANVVPGQLMEACNNIDDDCDGMVDEGITQVGQMCTKPGQLGVCQFGTFTCPMGATQLTCDAPLPGTVQETCNGKDDDCNGTIDDPILVNNQPCMTGFPGVCATGTTVCSGGSSTCNPMVTPGSQPEICDNKDNNCNGQTDEMNPTPACSSQNPMAGGVSTWSCTMGTCQISTCAVGAADIDGAQGNGCECATDQHANSCVAAASLSVPAGSAGVNMLGKIEAAMGSDWITFNFIAPAVLGTAYRPKVQLVNNAGGQYAMDVMADCMSLATCNDGGSGNDISLWELNYVYDQMGNPQGPWSDMDPKITSVKVRVYRKNGTPPTCDQYTVTATNL
jgi:Putative metal-binding motif